MRFCFVFFEGMLIPLYLIIGMWGGPRRVCFGEAVSLYLVGLFADAGGLDLSFLSNRRQLHDVDFQNLKQIPLGVQQLLLSRFSSRLR